MTALPLEPLPARVLAGRYTLLEPLGRGGMSIVWRAEDQLLRRLVAVKELLLPRTLPPEEIAILRERMMREARAACAVLDPAAVTVHDVVEEDGTPYLVMELVRARTLAQVVSQEGPLPPEQVAQFGLALLGALAAAHRADVIHRDVKPGNVLVTDDGRAMLTDFGIAATSTEIGLTADGMLLGSPAYVAPERARGAPGGPESDLWSLGSTLYTAVEGVPAFDGPTQVDTLRAVVDGKRRRCVLAGALTPVLAALLDRPASRRPDARELEGMLRGVLSGAPLRIEPTVAPPAARQEPVKPALATRLRPSRATAVGGALAALIMTAWALHNGGAGPRQQATLINGALVSIPPDWHAGPGALGVIVVARPGEAADAELIAQDRAAWATRGHHLVSFDGSRSQAFYEWIEPGRHTIERALTAGGQVWVVAATTTQDQWTSRSREARAIVTSLDPP